MAEIRVLLPTFNRPGLLIKAIESVRAQTFADWKLLVINDGGDDVEPLTKAFGDPRIEGLQLPHGGKSRALNAGIEQTEEPYLAYLDDDDVFFPHHLDVLHEGLKSHWRCQLAFADTYATDVILEADGTRRFLHREIEHEGAVQPHELWFRNYINHKCVLHERRLIETVGPYDEQLSVFIDWDMLRRMAGATPFHHVPLVTSDHFLYRNADQITTRAPRDASFYKQQYHRVVLKGLPSFLGWWR
ncbi:MAG: glycosyltransferase family 2 protein [Bacteroidota bacterium]